MIHSEISSLHVEELKTNQYIIHTPLGRLFQSYTSRIAFVANNGDVTLGTAWDYSRTTMKYLHQFLGTTASENRRLLLTGEYKMDSNL